MSPRPKADTGGIDAPDTPPKAPPKLAAFVDVKVPKTQDDLEEIIGKGIARALEMASNAKELTEALKVALEWHDQKYGKDEDEGVGSGFAAAGRNGHGG